MGGGGDGVPCLVLRRGAPRAEVGAALARALPGAAEGCRAALADAALGMAEAGEEGLFALDCATATLAVLCIASAPAEAEGKPRRPVGDAAAPPATDALQEVEVACGDQRGVLDLRCASSGRFVVRTPDGRVLKPTQFEAAGGFGRQKKWRKNVTVAGTGERVDAWLQRMGLAA